MIRSSGSFSKTSAIVKSVDPIGDAPAIDLKAYGLDVDSSMDRVQAAIRYNATIGNAERPSNLWYKVTGQSSYWYMYALMDYYKSEVSVLSTLIHRSVTELLRYGIGMEPKFMYKCIDCGYETDDNIDECPECHSKEIRRPDRTQLDYFKRPNGKSFIDDANDNGMSMKDVIKSYALSEYLNNQAYLLCVTGDIIGDDGRNLRSYPLEFIPYDPKFVKYLYDEKGKPGVEYAFTRDNRNAIINLNKDPDALNMYSAEGKELYPAVWQIGTNYGATGEYWLYTAEEVYQDHWFAPSLIYGVPIWYDIEDDLQTYAYLEKRALKKYKFGYVRKMMVLPGFNDEDVEDITKGVQDVLSKNDNSIPIVCLPPQMPGTAKMDAQVLDLMPDNSEDDLMQKSDIRDRLCAHIGVPNLFAGDVEQSGGMNNESQQITVYDRYLMDKYDYIDRLCDWIMSWFPKITDWVLRVRRPSKAYGEEKRFMDEIQKMQVMKNSGFDVFLRDGKFHFSPEPVDQVMRRQQEQAMMQQQMMAPELTGGMMDGGLMPGDGDGPPEKGTARREDSEIGDSGDEIDLSKREAEQSMGV